MTGVRTKRRRVRNIRPEVLQALREGLISGASAPQVHAALLERFPAAMVPSDRTISNIAREIQRDDAEGPWRLEDADPDAVATVLAVLREVATRTEGRVTSLSQSEARLIPTMYRALDASQGRWEAKAGGVPIERTRDWHTYVWTRFYLSWVRSAEDEQDFALLLAVLQREGRYPLPIWSRVERVNDALNGWLPSDITEMRDER
jgi:hypothetical protein